MTSRAWLITALSLSVAVSSAAAEEFPPRSPFDDAPATKRAGDYFSRGGRASMGITASRPPATSTTRSPADSSKAAKSTTKAAPKWDESSWEDEESPFGAPATEKASEKTADKTFQRLRNKSTTSTEKSAEKAPIRTASSETDEDFGAASKTPSGASLSRSASTDEEESGVIHATHDADSKKPAGKIEKMSATRKTDADEAENPFVPVEEFLKNDTTDPKRPRSPASRTAAPKSDFVVKPHAKTAETKPAADRPSGNVTLSGRPGARRPATEVSRMVHSEDHSMTTESMDSSVLDGSINGSQAPQVSVRWVKKSEINLGQPCDCDLVVKNSGSVAAQEVIVEAWFPRTVRLTAAKPEPSNVTDHLEWKFPTLAAGEEQAIHISMIPSRKGELATTANVRYTGSAAGVFEVEEPMLAVSLKGAKEVLVGDPASQIITVSNPGTGVAKNVTVEATIPKGLEHPRGERLQMDVGSLGPGESRTIRLSLSAIGGGNCQIQVTAKADSGLVQTAATDILVIAPSVKLALEGPSLRYIGRTAMYLLSTMNDGAAPSNNVRVMHKVPEGFKFVRADRGGKYDESSHTVTWFVGRLEPGQTIQCKLELAPMQVGTFAHHASAVSEQGAKAEQDFETVVEGTAALQMEIVEQADPVEVGAEMMYEIRLKNNGSKAAENVGISCELASAVQLLTAKGPTEALSENGVVVFKSMPSLAPGKTAVYRVAVRAVQEGAHRFRVRLASESITEPLISEELTKFYGE